MRDSVVVRTSADVPELLPEICSVLNNFLQLNTTNVKKYVNVTKNVVSIKKASSIIFP